MPSLLNARSIITNSNDIVEIEVISQNRNITLTADGQAETILSLVISFCEKGRYLCAVTAY